MRINVVGGGPIGGNVAYLLARKGFEVHIYEEHEQVGKPVQCTGLITSSLDEILPGKKDFVVNTPKIQEVNSPDGSKISFKSKEYVVDRALFDNFFINKAVDAGAVLHLSHHFIGASKDFLLFKKNNGKGIKVNKSITIGADGPLSKVAKSFDLYGKREFLYGIQAKVKGSFDPDVIQTFFGKDVAPHMFAWIVPEGNKIARVGLATKDNAREYFNHFMRKHCFNSIEIQAGPIPVYNSRMKIETNEIYLIGDAAAQVKATTMGGLIPGLKAGFCLAKAIKNEVSYTSLFKPVARELWLHLKLRQLMDKFSDMDWNNFVADSSEIKPLIEKYSRDKPFKLLRAVAFKPSLIKYVKFIF